MFRRVLSVCAIVAAAVAMAGPAGSTGYRSYKSVRETPIKDCTRINGRYGYYGNPWCTPQEQARFDRWSASRR